MGKLGLEMGSRCPNALLWPSLNKLEDMVLLVHDYKMAIFRIFSRIRINGCLARNLEYMDPVTGEVWMSLLNFRKWRNQIVGRRGNKTFFPEAIAGSHQRRMCYGNNLLPKLKVSDKSCVMIFFKSARRMRLRNSALSGRIYLILFSCGSIL